MNTTEFILYFSPVARQEDNSYVRDFSDLFCLVWDFDVIQNNLCLPDSDRN